MHGLDTNRFIDSSSLMILYQSNLFGSLENRFAAYNKPSDETGLLIRENRFADYRKRFANYRKPVCRLRETSLPMIENRFAVLGKPDCLLKENQFKGRPDCYLEETSFPLKKPSYALNQFWIIV